MEFPKILAELKEKANKGASSYIDAYLQNEDAIVNQINANTGLKSEIWIRDYFEQENLIKQAAIFSDFTSLVTYNAINPQSPYHIKYFSAGSEYAYNRQLTIPPSMQPLLLRDGKLKAPIEPCYIYRNDKDTKDYTNAIAPLMETQRIILRPTRALMMRENEKEINIHYALSNTPTTHWTLRDDNDTDTIMIDNGLSSIQMQTLMTLTLPYFVGISMENLTNIVRDESDILRPFRASLKALVVNKEFNVNTIREVQNDIINPQLDTINRKFKVLNQKHTLKVAGSVGAFALSLVAVSLTGNANFQDILKWLIGSGVAFGFGGILSSEKEFISELDKLKDNPYFLLWKIEQHK